MTQAVTPPRRGPGASRDSLDRPPERGLDCRQVEALTVRPLGEMRCPWIGDPGQPFRRPRWLGRWLAGARVFCGRMGGMNWTRLARLLVLALLLIGCATTSPLDLATLLEPDPRLPKKEHVQAVGTIAIQRLVALSPKAAEIISKHDLYTVTGGLVTAMFRFPVEQLAADPPLFELTAYALAHQWGLTQLALDHVARYDRLITHRYEELQQKKAAMAWSNFFYALSTMGYAMSTVSAAPTQRFSNELGISRNQQAMQVNNLMAEYYQQRIETLEEFKLQVSRLKPELVSYSNLLEIYRGWLFKAQEDHHRHPLPHDAKQMLEVKATF